MTSIDPFCFNGCGKERSSRRIHCIGSDHDHISFLINSLFSISRFMSLYSQFGARHTDSHCQENIRFRCFRFDLPRLHIPARPKAMKRIPFHVVVRETEKEQSPRRQPCLTLVTKTISTERSRGESHGPFHVRMTGPIVLLDDARDMTNSESLAVS